MKVLIVIMAILITHCVIAMEKKYEITINALLKQTGFDKNIEEQIEKLKTKYNYENYKEYVEPSLAVTKSLVEKKVIIKVDF